MEKTMSKTNDSSNVTLLDHHSALADSELHAATGGTGDITVAVASARRPAMHGAFSPNLHGQFHP
jgi:hypothetical protein